MEEFDKYLINLVKDNIINLDEYTELKNCNLLNIKENLNLIQNKNNIELKQKFKEIYKNFIKEKDNKLIYKNKIILNRLINKSNLEYTSNQKEGINEIIKFISNKEEKYFGLFGYAGTGKTTTIIDFLMNCIEMKYINSIIFTAPTNKALNVIKIKISNRIKYLLKENNLEYENNLSFDMNCDKLKKINIIIDFQTIHKFLHYKSEYNQEGEIIFTKDKNNIIEGYDIIIVDECSMIPLEMIYEIFKESEKIKTKIIFTGDPAQLPPVNEKLSTIFITEKNQLNIDLLKKISPDITEEKYLKFIDNIFNMNKYILKEIVRTKNNSIMKCSNTIRDWIYNIDDIINVDKYTNINFKLYSFDKSAKTKTRWYKDFEEQIQLENDTIIIAWTNEEVKYYNNYIRKSLFKKQIINEYENGELLILNEFYSPKISNENIVNKIKFNTSEKIVIKDIENIKIKFELIDELKKNLKIFKNHKSIETKYNKFINTINEKISKIELEGYKLKVNKIDDILNIYEIFIIANKSQEIYKNITINIIEEIKKFRNELFKSYELLSIDNNIIKPLYNEFHSKYINKFAQVSYGYSITCHKAQGSNYKNVFVDFSDIAKNNNFEEMKRCMYTAVSRTIDNLYILI
jgi:hypothetical protein